MVIIFDRYTERSLEGGIITFDRTQERYHHIRLNVNASRMLGLQKGLRVQFVKMDSQWYLATTKLNRGYLVLRTGRGAFRINSKAFVNHLLNELLYSVPCAHFAVRATAAEYGGSVLFKIEHHKLLKLKNA